MEENIFNLFSSWKLRNQNFSLHTSLPLQVSEVMPVSRMTITFRGSMLTWRSCFQRHASNFATCENGNDNFRFLNLVNVTRNLNLYMQFSKNFFFWPHCSSMWDLPWPGIEPMTPTVGVWSLNNWTTREALLIIKGWQLFNFFKCRGRGEISKMAE